MKKTNKLWLALLLTVLVAALLAVGFTAAAEEPTIIGQGYCGLNGSHDMTWVLTNDGTLTISGTENMTEYSAPWDHLKSYIRNVIVEDGVKSIGNLAFADCTSIRRVKLARSVREIKGFAFQNCTSLESVTLGAQLSAIYEFAFDNCSSLKRVTMSDYMVLIDHGVFQDCTSLETVYIYHSPYSPSGYDLDVERWNEPYWNANHYYLDGHEHTAGEPVHEYETAATCTTPGNYDEVIYCTDCGNEISWETKTVSATGHTPSRYVRETITEPTCTEDGSYDEVYYCKNCNYEFSRTSHVMSALGHDWEPWEILTTATTQADGLAKRVCQRDPDHVLTKTVPRIQYIEFGSYPQTKVEETDALSAALETATWKGYDYLYRQSEHVGVWGGCMQYADFFCNGEKYRAVHIDCYREDRYINLGDGGPYMQAYNGYTTGNTYYFKYEPLIWRVLDPDTGYVVCESVIDSQNYQAHCFLREITDDTGTYNTYVCVVDDAITAYVDEYAASSLRAWLNADFYETAFTEQQKAKIVTTELENEGVQYQEGPAIRMYDKIFLPHYTDIATDAYEFSLFNIGCDAEKIHGTDYARCQGLTTDMDEWSFLYGNGTAWWLRSPGAGRTTAMISGGFRIESVGESGIGVRPACILSDLNSDNTVSEYLVSADTRLHTPAAAVHENEIAATCTEAGSYDEVVYCTQCDYEFSREHITVDHINHRNAYDAPAVEATETAHGHTAGLYCPDCETWLSGEVVHNALGAQTVIRPATEEEEGLIDIVCTVCGETVRYTAEKLPHTDPQPSGTGDTGNGFWMRIQSAFRGFIDWFLRLFRFFG